MSKHTPEPWNGKRIGIAVHYFESINTEIALTGKSDETMANARRIVACVMACRGLSTDELEQHGLVSAVGTELMELEKQRDELLAALQGMIDIANDSQGVAGYHLNGEVADWGEFEEWQAACDAIAKIKGGAENHSPAAGKMVVPEGWQLVPVEPTEAMLNEICLTEGFSIRALSTRYRAMLSAAPKPELKLTLGIAPIGTLAPCIMGGRWYRTEHGWKWNGPDGSGGTFPRPGGDWTGELIAPNQEGGAA